MHTRRARRSPDIAERATQPERRVDLVCVCA
jgi:hypothetical protein